MKFEPEQTAAESIENALPKLANDYLIELSNDVASKLGSICQLIELEMGVKTVPVLAASTFVHQTIFGRVFLSFSRSQFYLLFSLFC